MRFRKFTKSVIVIVVFVGIFFGYGYVRIVRPYIDVGGIIVKVPESEFYRQSVSVEGQEYSYWTNGINNPEKILVMLPPSSSTGDYFGRYAKIFPDYLIIAPDYPGRGLTSKIKSFDTAPKIAARTTILIKSLVGDKEIILVGPSFGGMVATEMAKRNQLNISSVILVATGEFFAPDQQALFHLVFYPGKISEKARNWYLEAILKRNLFTNVSRSNVEEMLEQWLTTLGYRIESNSKIQIPAVIISFTADNVVREDSVQKLETLYPNHKTYYLNLLHVTDSFFDPALVNIIKNNN